MKCKKGSLHFDNAELCSISIQGLNDCGDGH